jgi:hypothetical protein
MQFKLKATFSILLLLISITIGVGSNLPFETFSSKLLRNSENHDIPELSIKSIDNAFIEAFQAPQASQTINLRSKAGRKTGRFF